MSVLYGERAEEPGAFRKVKWPGTAPPRRAAPGSAGGAPPGEPRGGPGHPARCTPALESEPSTTPPGRTARPRCATRPASPWTTGTLLPGAEERAPSRAAWLPPCRCAAGRGAAGGPTAVSGHPVRTRAARARGGDGRPSGSVVRLRCDTNFGLAGRPSELPRQRAAAVRETTSRSRPPHFPPSACGGAEVHGARGRTYWFLPVVEAAKYDCGGCTPGWPGGAAERPRRGPPGDLVAGPGDGGVSGSGSRGARGHRCLAPAGFVAAAVGAGAAQQVDRTHLGKGLQVYLSFQCQRMGMYGK